MTNTIEKIEDYMKVKMRKTTSNRTMRGRVLSMAFGITILLLLSNGAGASSYAYISNSGGNTVSVIDTATNTVTATVNVGNAQMLETISHTNI